MQGIDFGTIIKRSWELTQKNKWLWIYGAVLALSGGSSSFSGGGGSGGSKSLPTDTPSQFGEKGSKVLGAATNQIYEWIISIPPTTMVLLLVAIAAFLLLGLIVGWVLRSWAQASLIAGLDETNTGNFKTITSSSKVGISKIKPFIIFNTISMLIGLGTIISFITISIAGVFLFSFSSLFQNIWIMVVIFVGGLTFIFTIVALILTEAYATRLMVLKNFPAWSAWKRAFSLSKKYFLPSVILGIINSTLGCVTGCATLIVVALIGVPAFFVLSPTISRHSFSLWQLPPLGLLAISGLYLLQLINGVFIVFKTGTWNLLFHTLIEKEESHE